MDTLERDSNSLQNSSGRHRIPLPQKEVQSLPVSPLIIANYEMTGSPSGLTTILELVVSLNNAVSTVLSFCAKQFATLQQEEVKVHLYYGNNLTLPTLQEVDRHELKGLHDAFQDLHRDLVKLQWYHSVNLRASERLAVKLRKLLVTARQFPGDGDSKSIVELNRFGSSLVRELQRLEETIKQIRIAQSDSKQAVVHKSLYLTNHSHERCSSLQYSDLIYQAIKADEVSNLVEGLENVSFDGTERNQRTEFLYGLLFFSTTCQSKECMLFLLKEALPKNEIQPSCIYLNHLIIVFGRNASCNAEKQLNSYSNHDKISRKRHDSLVAEIISEGFKSLGPHENKAVDDLGRLPLHYAAKYGLTEICKQIFIHIKVTSEQSHEAANEAIRSIFSIDRAMMTPLHHALICNHPTVVELLLDTLWTEYLKATMTLHMEIDNLLADLLFIAIRSQNDAMVHKFANYHFDLLHFQSSRGESPLYVAAQIGRTDYINTLLEDVEDPSDIVDLAEMSFGWTPLFIACAKGHQAVVEFLLEVGANESLVDLQGWTAQEIAVYRGSLGIAALFKSCEARSGIIEPTSFNASVSSERGLRGNGYYIVAHLGVMQKDRTVSAVDLDCCSSELISNTYPDTRYSIHISTLEATESNYSEVVRLPILEDQSSKPFIFPISTLHNAKLSFTIHKRTAEDEKENVMVGRGIAFLESQPYFGEGRESLVRDHTVPILGREKLDFKGSVTFTYLIAKSFLYPAAWESPVPRSASILNAKKTQLVGHRGFGQNTANREHLQLGENTVESFLSAAKAGASFVEFDVQLTRDLVPIIYHDFSLSESGTDIPIHDISIEQFLYASKNQSPYGKPISVIASSTRQPRYPEINSSRRRSKSLAMRQEKGAVEVQERMKYAVDYIKKGFKPNTRGDYIQDSFATLEQLLVELPESIGFNIEIKYPRIHEAVDACVAPVSIEINTFVETALNKVFRHAGNRPIILSSCSF